MAMFMELDFIIFENLYMYYYYEENELICFVRKLYTGSYEVK